MKTVTYVPGTFVTLVPGPYKRGIKGDFFEEVKPSMTAEISHGPSFPKLIVTHNQVCWTRGVRADVEQS